MEILFLIVPLFIGFVFLLILIQIVGGVAEWARNNASPVESAPARVVAKRIDTWGSGRHHGSGRVRSSYYATFELKSGERMEFGLYGKDFGLLVEGDEGELRYQGTRYLGFDRRHAG